MDFESLDSLFELLVVFM